MKRIVFSFDVLWHTVWCNAVQDEHYTWLKLDNPLKFSQTVIIAEGYIFSLYFRRPEYQSPLRERIRINIIEVSVLYILYHVSHSFTNFFFFKRVNYEGRLERHTKFGLQWIEMEETLLVQPLLVLCPQTDFMEMTCMLLKNVNANAQMARH